MINKKMKLKKKLQIKTFDIYLIIIMLVILMTYILIKKYTIKSYETLMNYATNTSQDIVSIIISKSISEIINNYQYEELIIIEKNNNDEIINLNFNNEEVNKILYLMTDNIMKTINILEKEKYKELNIEYFDESSLIYKIPFGIIYDIPILVGIGPSIPFKVNVLSSVNNSINTNVKEYGINNSLIEVILNIELTIQIILPFSSENKKIEKQIPLDTKIIQGKIPEFYGGLITNKTS